jgi:hypothetical protein
MNSTISAITPIDHKVPMVTPLKPCASQCSEPKP